MLLNPRFQLLVWDCWSILWRTGLTKATSKTSSMWVTLGLESPFNFLSLLDPHTTGREICGLFRANLELTGKQLKAPPMLGLKM